jgi:hypothetical protein
MVRLALIAGLLLFASAATAAPSQVNLAAWVATWPETFAVAGVKTEPTYLGATEIRRDGSTFTLIGGAPAWADRAVEAISVDAGGHMRHVRCPVGLDCAGTPRPTGFLASAAVLSAARAGRLSLRGDLLSYGGRAVVCVPAEAIGVSNPILDPCLDYATGAVVAQRHRLSGRFDGPSLDPDTLRISANRTSAPPSTSSLQRSELLQ